MRVMLIPIIYCWVQLQIMRPTADACSSHDRLQTFLRLIQNTMYTGKCIIIIIYSNNNIMTARKQIQKVIEIINSKNLDKNQLLYGDKIIMQIIL